MSELATRFWTKVDVGDCWLWTGAKDSGGYGSFKADGRSTGAHRWAWEHLVGPITEGHQIDHLCRNRACVNPDHLEPVTRAENQRRGLHGQFSDRCKRGHSYADAYITPDGSRQCRTCQREHDRRHRRE